MALLLWHTAAPLRRGDHGHYDEQLLDGDVSRTRRMGVLAPSMQRDGWVDPEIEAMQKMIHGALTPARTRTQP